MGFEARRLLRRFRVGVAPLQVELGRRHTYPHQEDSRACRVCGYHQEDEEHFLMECPLYDELRTSLIETTTARLQTLNHNYADRSSMSCWVGGTKAARFDIIMGLPDKVVVKALAAFLKEAFTLKAEYLARLVSSDGSLVLARDRRQPGRVGRIAVDRCMVHRLSVNIEENRVDDVEVFIRVDPEEEDVILEP